MKLIRTVGLGSGSYFTSVSQGLILQLRAFVCLTASDELMNGLFNKPPRHVKVKEQKKEKKAPRCKPRRAIQTTLAASAGKLEGLNFIVQDPWRRPRPTPSPTLRRAAPLSFIYVIAASVIKRQRGQEPGPPQPNTKGSLKVELAQQTCFAWIWGLHRSPSSALREYWLDSDTDAPNQHFKGPLLLQKLCAQLTPSLKCSVINQT